MNKADTTLIPRSAATEGSGADEEVQRKQIAKRLWLNAQDQEAPEHEATKARYTYLEDGKSFDFTPTTDHPATRMLAIFGALTLMGNLTNTWKNEKGDRAPSPIDVIAERFGLLETGEWIDRTREGVGARVDIPTLAQAWLNVIAAAGKTPKYDPPTVEQMLTDKPDLVKTLRRDPKVTAEYARLRGAAVVDASSLMDEMA